MTDNQVELMPEFLQQEHIGGDETPFCSVLLEKLPCVPYPSLCHIHAHYIAAHA